MKGMEEGFIEIGGIQVPSDFIVECKWVTEELAFGGMIGTVANMRGLRENGFTHVLDLQAEFDDSDLGAEAGTEVLWLAVPEPITALPPEIIERAVAFANEVLSDRANKLYVHCLAGRNRAPLFAYAILRSMGQSPHQALQRIRALEPKARLGEGHLSLIEEFFSWQSTGEFA